MEYLLHLGISPKMYFSEDQFLGDHSGQKKSLKNAEQHFIVDAYQSSSDLLFQSGDAYRLNKMHLSFKQIETVLEGMVESNFGSFIRNALISLPCPSRNVIGISILWSGQILPAMFLSKQLKKFYPKCKIIWGGPYITALSKEIPEDERYGGYADAFLPGHCELSLVELIENMKFDRMRASGIIIPGKIKPQDSISTSWPDTVLPDFSDELHFWPDGCILPVQISRGCPYGRCAYCTYPHIEGKYRCTSLDLVNSMVKMAIKNNSVLSFKDSLIPLASLRDIGRIIGGKINWSACTKLNGSLSESILIELAENGLHTLEVGLETIDAQVLILIDRSFSKVSFQNLLQGVAKSNIHLIVNCMTGFPGQDEKTASKQIREVKKMIDDTPQIKSRIEHNTLEVHRLSRMGRDPSKYGIKITKRWPWASSMGWSLK